MWEKRDYATGETFRKITQIFDIHFIYRDSSQEEAQDVCIVSHAIGH